MRRSNAKLRWISAALAGILLAVPTVSAAQDSQNPPPQNQMAPNLSPLPPPFGNGDDNLKTVEQSQIERAQNAQWQKQLTRDSAKLLELAQQLKEEVDKSNGSTLSVDVIKKATEIDKLAKSVKSAAAFASKKQH